MCRNSPPRAPGRPRLLALDGLRIAGPATGSAAARPPGRPPCLPRHARLAEAIARIAAGRAAPGQPPPAPFYLRGADAAPPADPPPVILAMTPAALGRPARGAASPRRAHGQRRNSRLYDGDPLAFVLVEGDAAFLLGRVVAGEAELLTLAVAPEAAAPGLGRQLVARFVYQARLRGRGPRLSGSRRRQCPPPSRFTNRPGFTTDGPAARLLPAPDGARIDALVMARDLLTPEATAPSPDQRVKASRARSRESDLTPCGASRPNLTP